MKPEVLRVLGVTKFYGPGKGINAASLTVSPGQIVALAGPNGAGKTTLLHLITGVVPCSVGNISICGHDMRTSPVQARQRLGFVPDRPEVIELITVMEFLTFVGTMYGLASGTTRNRTVQLLDLLGMSAAQNLLMGSLSHGMRRKVQLAAALLHHPSLLVMDEPTNALDPSTLLLLQDMLQELKRSGTGILLATHHLTFVDEVCDYVYFVNDSRLVVSGSPRELKTIAGCQTLNQVFLHVTGGGSWRDKVAQVLGPQ